MKGDGRSSEYQITVTLEMDPGPYVQVPISGRNRKLVAWFGEAMWARQKETPAEARSPCRLSVALSRNRLPP
jgi:hypothetical protein